MRDEKGERSIRGAQRQRSMGAGEEAEGWRRWGAQVVDGVKSSTPVMNEQPRNKQKIGAN